VQAQEKSYVLSKSCASFARPFYRDFALEDDCVDVAASSVVDGPLKYEPEYGGLVV
jgi:hypothetical protein